VRQLVDAAVEAAEAHAPIATEVEGIRAALFKLGIPFKRP